MRVLVCGSRGWSNAGVVIDRMRRLSKGTIIVHGDCPDSPDRLAAAWWTLLEDGADEPHPADWETHGKGAGVIRNIEMLESGVDLVLAFWNGESRGTKHTIDAARRRGIPVEVISP